MIGSSEQKGLPEKESVVQSNDPDWRVRVVSHLADDMPSAYIGGPSHKKGAIIITTTVGKDANGQFVGFPTPSAIALALELAVKAADRASVLQEKIDKSPVDTPFGPGSSVTCESVLTLYNYLQECMTVLAFSFQALEAFCNETISSKISGTYPLERRKIITHVSADELERQASTEDKLGTILPKLLSVPSPKGSRIWNDFVDLKRARDSTVHIKSNDSNPKVAQRSDLDDATLFHRFLHADSRSWVRAAIAMLDYYADADLPRWLNPAKKMVGLHGNPHARNQKKPNQPPRRKRKNAREA